FFRMLHRAGRSIVIGYRTHTGKKIQFLTNRNIQGAYSPAYRSRQRAFDRDLKLFDSFQRIFRKPFIFAIKLEGFFAGVYFEPFNFFLSPVRSFNSAVQDMAHGGSYIDTNAVTFNEWDNGIITNL